MFRFFRKQHTSPSWLLDKLYRITLEELNSAFKQHFNIEIACGDQRFLQPSSKLGASNTCELIGTMASRRLPEKEYYKADGAVIKMVGNELLLHYATKSMDFRLVFTGDEPSILAWARALKADLPFYLAVFTYIFNRYRAERAMHAKWNQESTNIDELNRIIREDGPTNALQHLVKFIHPAQGAIIWLYNDLAGLLLPAFWTPQIIGKSLSPIDFTSPDNGNTMGMSSFSAKEVSYLRRMRLTNKDATIISSIRVPFGNEQSVAGRNTPRGVIEFVYSTNKELSSEEETTLRVCSREIAAYTNEIDENIETKLFRAAIQAVDDKCSKTERGRLDTDMINWILSDLEERACDSISSYHLSDKIAPSTNFGYVAGNTRYGSAQCDPPAVTDPMLHVRHYNNELCFISPSGIPGAYLLARGSTSGIGALRTHVFQFLSRIVRLAHQFGAVDRRRMAWMQQTIHEVRHPLTGLIWVESEISRLVEDPQVSKRQIAYWTDDLKTSCYRLEVLLTFLNHIGNIEAVRPQVANVRIEGDVLRPIRRLLTGDARKRGIVLEDTVNYEAIDPFRSDPQLLSLMFYNLYQNAIKYSKRGSTVKVYCSKQDEFYSIEISNIGGPIHPEEEPRLFEEGFRGREAERREIGLGIGLSVVRKIATNLECLVSLVSAGRDQQPVTFGVYVPRRLQI